MTYFKKTIIQGTHDDGSIDDIPITNENHLEIEVHGPIHPYGEIHAERLHPLIQGTATYGINSTNHRTTTYLSGTVTTSGSMFICSTGTQALSFGTFQSRRRAKYRANQGLVARFGVLWSDPVASSIVVAGIGHAESGYFFGYNGTSFGILHSNGGVREIRTLTINTKSSHADSIDITFNDVVTPVTVTNGASAITTASEINKTTFTGWVVTSRGNKVIFVADDVGSKNGTYSLSNATSAAGTFVRSTTGVVSNDIWIPQTDWNGDQLLGAGSSGITLNKQKGNVFHIGVQHGFGNIIFKVETVSSNLNNSTFTTVHTIRNPNTRTTPNLTNPSFTFTMSAYSTGSITDVSVKCGNYGIFNVGDINSIENNYTYSGQITTATDTTYVPIFTIVNSNEFNGRANQSVVNFISLQGAMKHTQPATFYLVKNATLVGSPNFVLYSSSSSTYVDTASTSLTFSDNNQVVFSIPVGETTSFHAVFTHKIDLQPDDSISVCVKASTGSPAYCLASLNSSEEQ
jgi:hypothetical protein